MSWVYCEPKSRIRILSFMDGGILADKGPGFNKGFPDIFPLFGRKLTALPARPILDAHARTARSRNHRPPAAPPDRWARPSPPCACSWPRSVQGAPAEFRRRLRGLTIAAVSRRGKYIGIEGADGTFFTIHLRMTGKLVTELGAGRPQACARALHLQRRHGAPFRRRPQVRPHAPVALPRRVLPGAGPGAAAPRQRCWRR